MRQPPKETWCQTCKGEGVVLTDYDEMGACRRRCPDCDGSGESAESLNWVWPGSEREGVR